MILWNICRIL